MRKLSGSDFDRLARALARDPDLLAAYCFGSQADAARRNPRDLDIAVLAEEPLTLPRELELRALVSGIVGSDAVDLVDLRKAGPVLKRQVVKSGRLLFARDRVLVSRFELEALWEYRDSAYRRRVQLDYLAGRRARP